LSKLARIRAQSASTRTTILDTTEQLMLTEGYAAVSTRRVAGECGLKAPLVHYYFRTTDDLLLAVYARAAEQMHERLIKALHSKDPLRALWRLNTDPSRTTLAVEFMALANHRKVVGAEIARNVERFRRMQAEALSQLADHPRLVDHPHVKNRRHSVDQPPSGPTPCPPVGLSLLLAGVSRALVMENALGISLGHAEARAFVEQWIESVGGQARKKARVGRPSTKNRRVL
jgi:AcrR family transcriptional regulator